MPADAKPILGVQPYEFGLRISRCKLICETFCQKQVLVHAPERCGRGGIGHIVGQPWWSWFAGVGARVLQG